MKPNNFYVLIKPASSLCNMCCRYCFYEDVSNERRQKSYGIMNLATAYKIIDRVFEACPEGNVGFSFQGGEPTLATLNYFQLFVNYVESKKETSSTISYSIQTNGILIDDAWCELFKKYSFLVGISLDGLKDVHDSLRIDKLGKGTFNRVMNSIKLLNKYDVKFNILTVVTQSMAKHPQALWNAYVKNGFDFIQLIPCLCALDNPKLKEDYTLNPETYASFLKTFFDIWAKEFAKGNYISIRLFDNLVKMYQNIPPEQCGLLGFCQPQFVIEADGSVYPCDFYVLDGYNAGNIMDMDFDQIKISPAFKNFLTDQSDKSHLCNQCSVYGLCGGGCKRYRSFFFQKEGYCPYQDFLVHASPTLRHIAFSLQNR